MHTKILRFIFPFFIEVGFIDRAGFLHFHERDLANSFIYFATPSVKTRENNQLLLLAATGFQHHSFKSLKDAAYWIIREMRSMGRGCNVDVDQLIKLA